MDKNDLLLEEWKMASELHRHTDNIAWQSLNFFMATNGALLAILGAIIISDKYCQNNPLSIVIAIAITIVGIIISFSWALIQKRLQLYAYYRSAQANQVEEQLLIDKKRVLTLYEHNLNEQDLLKIDKFDRYLKSTIGKWRNHSLIVLLGFSLAIVWVFLLLIFVAKIIFIYTNSLKFLSSIFLF